MQIRLAAGRELDARDGPEATAVVMINQAMADRYWPGQDPIGRRFKWGGHDSEDPWRTIVGVLGDVRHFGLDHDPAPEVYMPLAQTYPPSRMSLVVRASTEPEALLKEGFWEEARLVARLLSSLGSGLLRSLDVEARRVREGLLVAVPRRIEQQHPVSFANILARERAIARCRAVHVLDRRDPSQHFLHGRVELSAVRT